MKIASMTVKYGRKYQIADYDMVTLEASLHVTVDEDEANDLDPLSAYAELFGQVRAAVRAQAFELVTRQQALVAGTRPAAGTTLPALAAAEEQPVLAEVEEVETDQKHAEPEPPAAPLVAGPPQTPEDAEQRFFARYGEQIGGTDWAAAQHYLNTRMPKPRTVARWMSVAERVRDRAAVPTTP